MRIAQEMEDRQAKDNTSPREKYLILRPQEIQTVLPKHWPLVLLGDPPVLENQPF